MDDIFLLIRLYGENTSAYFEEIMSNLSPIDAADRADIERYSNKKKTSSHPSK